MPIASPIGFLDVVNATLRASQVETTSRLTVANTAATKNFSVGDRFHVDKDSVDPVSVTGNVVASGIKISNLTISPIFDLGAVSNVGNTTSNTLQFANATTSFVASSNVEIGGNITLTSNAQVKVGSNVLAEYTGPHGREPKEMPLKKFPEILFEDGKFDRNDTTNTYTQAGYTVTASSSLYANLGFYPWRVFDGTIIASNTYHGWHSGGNPSTVSGAPYNTIDSSYVGEWIKLELPKAIKLDHFTIAPRDGYAFRQAPKDFKVYGSNNDSTWVELVEVTNATVYTNKQFNTTNVTTSDYYKYFALVIQDRVISGGAVAISGWELYGTEEPAPPGDLSLDTTLKSTFNSVRSNNYVMYFDGEDPAAGNVPKYLPSGSVKSITPNNVVFDATNNCWTLNGSTESNVTTGSLGLVGDTPHTVSTWINTSNLEANALTQQLFSIGSGYDKAFLKVDDTQIAANTWHNVTYAYQGEGGSKVTYVDGRKVEEAQVEDTFGDYPPFEMTDYETGGYRVSVSEAHLESVYRPFSAFNDGGTDINNVWHTPPSYTGTSSEYVGSVRLATNVDPGHWIKLETPHKLQVSYMTLVARPPVTNPNDLEPQAPKDFQVCGSNDDVNWDVLASFTGEAPQDDGTSKYTVNAQRGYKYLALAVNKGVNSTSVTIANIKFYGHKEGDLTRFPEPTRVLKYPHVAMTGPAQRGYVASASSSHTSYPPNFAFNNIISGNDAWINNSGSATPYNSSTGAYSAGVYSTTVAGHGAATGEFLQIEFPHKVKSTEFKIASYTTASGSQRAPRVGVIAGSNNGTTWDLLKSFTGLTSWTTGTFQTLTPDTNTTTYYKYFRLIVEAVNASNDGLTSVHGFELYGTQEDTGTPAIVGGPFAGKVANFRVYDQYLGDERIQEIYDAQKDEFGHKKSSMTLYEGRIGVGTTEPEGALTVIDEPHALAKFPARAISADVSYVEGDGQIKLSAADGSGYQAFDGLSLSSWVATPTRNTRLSEEVDFGAWLKIQTPESMSLKKAEIESKPDWAQVGTETYGGSIDNTTSGVHFGRAVACSHDGTRVIVGGYVYNNNQGLVKVYDWNGSSWTQVGSTLTGTAANDLFGRSVAISGDGNIIAVAAPREHAGSGLDDAGIVRVYYLNGSTWTILPDSGSLTTTIGSDKAFVGETAEDRLGQGGVKLSYDGYTVAMGEAKDDTGVANIGRIRVFTYSNGVWSQKGSTLLGNHTEEEFGQGLDMSEDGNHLIIGTKLQGGTSQPPRVEVYRWTGSAWAQKGSSITYADTADGFGPSVSISTDGNTIGVGIKNADAADGASADNAGVVYVYHWSGSAWGTPHKLIQPVTDDDDFGDHQVMSGDGKRIIVGASHADDGGTNSGRLYTFEYTGGSWVLREVPSVGADGGTNAYLGMGPSNSAHSHAISRDGSVIVAGESGFYTNGQAYSGRVRIYNMPSTIKSIWGSNDDVNWTKITTAPTREEATSNVAGLAFGYDDRLEFKNLDNPNYYKYHAIVADAFTQLKDVKLFGVRNQGSSTLHDGALTLTKNLDVPRIGPPLDADDTPRRDRLVVEYNTSTNPTFDGAVRDTSGRGNDGAFYGGVSYDASAKAFDFDGTDDYIENYIKNPAGAWIHTFSFWVKPLVTSTGETILQLGNHSASDCSTLRIENGTILRWFFHTNDITYTNPLIVGSYYHVVAAYDGGSVAASRRLWVNGVEIAQASNETPAALTLPENAKLRIGGQTGLNYFGGSISNFKLYDCALTAEEVKTLYDMGRCDEGGHIVNFSKTRVGIGLGDGEAPQAALDVRGDIRYITIAPIALPTLYDHILAGRNGRGIYPILGTNGGTKVYNVYCEPDIYGGGWMCFAQIPRIPDKLVYNYQGRNWSLFADEVGDSGVLLKPTGGTGARRHSTFSVPMSILSPTGNPGFNLDVLLMVYGDGLRLNHGAGAKCGTIWRGVNLQGAFNSEHASAVGTSGLATSSDGVDFVGRSYTLHNSTGWDFSISIQSGANAAGSYAYTSDAAGGYIVHSDTTTGGFSLYCASIYGPGASSTGYTPGSGFEYVRFFVRPSSF